MDRRNFVTNSLLIPAAAAVMKGEQATPAIGSGAVSLKEKFFGCMVGVYVGSALKGKTEGLPWPEIQRRFGTVDRMVGYQDYGNGWDREPGTTEDGAEREKFMITAIIEKKDRVTAEDVRAMWVRDMNPKAAGMISEPFERVLLDMAKSGIPASDIGRYCDYSGLVSMSRSCHALGLINAGDIDGAVQDVFEVGQLYQTTNSRGLQWAAITGIAIASATKPGATVDSVIADVLKGHPRIFNRSPAESANTEKYTHSNVLAEIERSLEATKKCKDFREMRVAFDSIYNGIGIPYAQAYASEVVTKAICVFNMVKGNTKEAMIAAVNMGRDTDCLSAVAAGISGALTGAGSVPEEWIKQVDYATTKMPITCSRRTVRQSADGVYDAFRARLSRMRSYFDKMQNA
jgi:ADP-ribosylglycohydrolase